MSEIRRIKDLLRGAYDGVNWYGPPLLKILDGLTAVEAAKKPVPAAHSIWESLLHVMACTREVARRLKGGTARDPEGGYWPQTLQASDEAWRNALDDLASAHDELLQALDSFQDDRLSEVVGSEREWEAGMTFYMMLHGLIQHSVYHSAQVTLMRRLIDAQTGGPEKTSSASTSS